MSRGLAGAEHREQIRTTPRGRIARFVPTLITWRPKSSEMELRSYLSSHVSARVAVMCAEALWWRCHRSLIADYLKAAGHTVIHIIDETKPKNIPSLQPRELLMESCPTEDCLNSRLQDQIT